MIRFDSGFCPTTPDQRPDRLKVRYTMAVRRNDTASARRSPRSTRTSGSTSTTPPTAGGPGRRVHLQTGEYRSQRPERRSSHRAPHPANRHRQATLWPDWRHHAFLTDLDLATVDVDGSTATTPSRARHPRPERRRRTRPRPLRQLPRQLGLAAIRRARPQPDPLDHHHRRGRVEDELTVARTIRTRLIALPGRLVNRAGRPTLRLPEHWPWATRSPPPDALRLLRPAPT